MSKLAVKILVGLPLVIFIDYVLMVALGCASCLFGFGDSWYCGPYCLAGKAILVLSLVGLIWYLVPELRKLFKKR